MSQLNKRNSRQKSEINTNIIILRKQGNMESEIKNIVFVSPLDINATRKHRIKNSKRIRPPNKL